LAAVDVFVCGFKSLAQGALFLAITGRAQQSLRSIRRNPHTRQRALRVAHHSPGFKVRHKVHNKVHNKPRHKLGLSRAIAAAGRTKALRPAIIAAHEKCLT
jgi:hypothetical protein